MHRSCDPSPPALPAPPPRRGSGHGRLAGTYPQNQTLVVHFRLWITAQTAHQSV